MNRLKESLQQICDGPCSCSVCRQRLSPTAVSCLGGHVVCITCRQQLTACVVCKKRFSTETHAAFKRVLELLPKCCRFKGCSYLPEEVNRLQDHEQWCGLRPCACKLCSWSGHARDLYSHCLKQHSVIHQSQRPLDIALDLRHDQASLCLMHTQDQVFWVSCGFVRATDTVTVQVVWEPNGVVTHNAFEATVNFELGFNRTSMNKPILHQQTTQDTAQLNQFIIQFDSYDCFHLGDTFRFTLKITQN